MTFRTQRFKKCTGAFAPSNIPVWVLLKRDVQISSKGLGPIYGKIVGHSLHNMNQGGIFARCVSSTSLCMMISISLNIHQHVVEWWSPPLCMMISMMAYDHQHVVKWSSTSFCTWWPAYSQMIIILSPRPQHLSSNSEDKVYLFVPVKCEDDIW